MRKFKEITAVIAVIAALCGCAKVTEDFAPSAENPKNSGSSAVVMDEMKEFDSSSVQLAAAFKEHGALYEPDEITEGMLVNRNGKQIVEHIIGVVVDDEGNGKILNTSSDANYIAYGEHVHGSKKGDMIETYLIYDTDCNYTDCCWRVDFIIS